MGLNDLIVAIALRCCVSRFPWLSYVGSCERKRKQYELDFVIFIERMAREPYSYSIMLVRYIRPDAIILSKLAEGEELWQSMLERKNIECAPLLATYLEELHLLPRLDMNRSVGKTAAICFGNVY